MNYWLLKSEPDAFSLNDLQSRPNQTEHWDGVRNYQVRNMLRDDIKKGDQAFFYHSSCKVPAIVGVVDIVSDGYPDHTAFDAHSKYFDAKSTPESPRWYMVDVAFHRTLKREIPLSELKQQAFLLDSDFALTRKGSRLSIMPVSVDQWRYILSLE
jgi:predicted RNA-binding protein with PUA-like domain